MSQVPRFCSIREPVLSTKILRGGSPTFPDAARARGAIPDPEEEEAGSQI